MRHDRRVAGVAITVALAMVIATVAANATVVVAIVLCVVDVANFVISRTLIPTIGSFRLDLTAKSNGSLKFNCNKKAVAPVGLRVSAATPAPA